MPDPWVSRRTALIAAGSFLAGGVSGPLAWHAGQPVIERLAGPPEPVIPDAPEGTVTLEQVRSAARGREVGLFTAVPAGHGDGAGLPVCMVLHGAGATTADFRAFGLPRFLTAAVQAGAAPFVLAGLDGGVIRWSRKGTDDPQRMLSGELPGWLTERGFSPVQAAWGWSMGGFGVLAYAAAHPGKLRAVAAFSPAISPDDDVARELATPGALGSTGLGIWCGTDDPLQPGIRSVVSRLDPPPRITNYSPGAHTRAYWNEHTVEAFRFIASALALDDLAARDAGRI